MRAVSDSTKYDNSPLQVVWRVSPVRCTANFTTIDYNRHNGKIYFGVQTHFEGEGTRELTESERARRGRRGWKYRIGNGAVIDPGQQGAGSVRTEAMAPGSYTITLSALAQLLSMSKREAIVLSQAIPRVYNYLVNSKLFASFFPVPASPAPEARYWRGPSGYRASDVYIALYRLLQEGPAMAFQLAQEHIGLVHPRTGEHLVLWSQYGWSPTPRISTAITITHPYGIWLAQTNPTRHTPLAPAQFRLVPAKLLCPRQLIRTNASTEARASG